MITPRGLLKAGALAVVMTTATQIASCANGKANTGIDLIDNTADAAVDLGRNARDGAANALEKRNLRIERDALEVKGCLGEGETVEDGRYRQTLANNGVPVGKTKREVLAGPVCTMDQ